MAPKIPPRPAGRQRSLSPGGRFAPSPLNEGFTKGSKALRFSPETDVNEYNDDPIERSGSVTIPNIGEEGNEYAAVAEELKKEEEEKTARVTTPEQTRSVADDLKLHAPKPSLPAHSAKQRVQTVTRTDSDKAASYGIGRPSSTEPKAYKKKSTASLVSNEDREMLDDEMGIPEIGQRVPMLTNAGDVQAPSPAPSIGPDGRVKHHTRRHSARDLPPGSYGMHGHGVLSTDKLDKAYYDKHPEILSKEKLRKYHDRQNDFSMSSSDLNKIVRDTASHGAGLGRLRTASRLRSSRTNPDAGTSEHHGTPTEEIGYEAHQLASRPGSTAPHVSSPLRDSHSGPQINVSSPGGAVEGEETYHVEGYKRRASAVPSSGDDAEEGSDYKAPILADDEVEKDPAPYVKEPAMEPPQERRGSVYEIENPPSRPTSRPASMLKEQSFDFEPTPLEDVREYEPLFDDEGNEIGQKPVEVKSRARHKFPSKDVWEDAPSSVHYTAEVETADATEAQKSARDAAKQRAETPAERFAKQQEELAEKEASRSYRPTGEQQKSTWLELQPKPSDEKARAKPHRFPSKDVWEDTPESQLYETTVSGPQSAEESRAKPAVPGRPKPKHTTSDDKVKPAVSDKPKPQIPARPLKVSASTDGEEVSKAKPAVPARPLGGKIAAMQAGFMSDLNKRLQLGPQAPKKEEPPAPDEEEEKEKAPLSDARKGRARGPQRRAPAKSQSPSPAVALESSKPTLTFSMAKTIYSIDPEDSNVAGDESEKTEETKALAANMAGETIVEAKLEKGDTVEPVAVEETAKE